MTRGTATFSSDARTTRSGTDCLSLGYALVLLATVIFPSSANAQAPENPVAKIDIPHEIMQMEQSRDGRWREPDEDSFVLLSVQESLGRALLSSRNKLWIVDITNPKKPHVLERHAIDAHITTAAQLSHDLRYVYVPVWHGIEEIATVQGVTNIRAITQAYLKVLDVYKKARVNRTLKTVLPTIVTRLENAGVGTLQAGAPPGLGEAERVRILNDYAYFLRLAGQPEKSIEVLGTVTRLQPGRTVAYLNLAEAYRDLVVPGASLGMTEDLRNKITLYYRKYRRLHGRSIPEFETLINDHLSLKRQGVCQYIAEQTNRGQLESISVASGRMDINGDGALERTVISPLGGTMGGEDFSVYSEAGEPLHLITYGSDDDRWNFGIKIVPYAGRYYIVHLQDERSTALSHVDRITSENLVNVECRYSQKVKETIAEAKEPALCQAALDGKLDYEPFNAAHHLTTASLKRWATYPGGAAVLDIENDGKPDVLVALGVDSSAGRGCDYGYLDMLDASRTHIETSARRDLLITAEGVDDGHACAGSDYRVVKYRGKYYLEGKYGGGELPVIKNDQFHRIVLIEKGKIAPICTFHFQTINVEK